MTVREISEKYETGYLSRFAAKACDAVRAVREERCDYRTEFQRDRDRILHSKSFRRLKHKTQVYIAPGDHYRMRMTHSLEVSQIARTIARGLRLNEDLTEAIALGHDVGHTPFGHVGEYMLREITGAFNHNEQSLRVVDIIERDGRGLNLTGQVRDGILCHTGESLPSTLEGLVVRICDRIAYLCHDFDDSQRAGVLSVTDLPDIVRRYIGETPSQMITAMVSDIINNSADIPGIQQSSNIQKAMTVFREFMFRQVYNSPALENDRCKARYVVKNLYSHYLEHPDLLPAEFAVRIDSDGCQRAVLDYIAGLTDLYAVSKFEQLFLPAKYPDYI